MFIVLTFRRITAVWNEIFYLFIVWIFCLCKIKILKLNIKYIPKLYTFAKFSMEYKWSILDFSKSQCILKPFPLLPTWMDNFIVSSYGLLIWQLQCSEIKNLWAWDEPELGCEDGSRKKILVELDVKVFWFTLDSIFWYRKCWNRLFLLPQSLFFFQ